MNKSALSIILFLELLAFSSTHAQLPAKPRKPPVGVPNDAAHFNGKWYRTYIEKTTWKSARDKCVQRGGQLVVIPDEPTQAFIRKFANGLQLWLGATDEKVEGLWVWVDGTEMKYTAWGRGQPSNSWGRENYLETMRDGNWNDVIENNKEIVGYICEWKDK